MPVNLANNENVLGPSPRAREAAVRALEDLHCYPERQNRAVLGALAELHGVDPTQILTGNGAQHVLRVIAATFLTTGQKAVALAPTYTGYISATQTMHATYQSLPAKHGGYDVGAWIDVAPSAQLLWLCSPNNPTGCVLKQQDAEAILQQLPRRSTVVFDAAYGDFVDDADAADGFRLLREDTRVIVVKTFSKLYGLAGLRLGYAVASADRIAAMMDRLDTFATNRPAQAAALAALADQNHQAATKRLVSEGRKLLRDGLMQLGLEVYPSQANFVTVRVGAARDRVVAEAHDAGYLIRPLSGPWGLPDAVRIGVGRPEHIHDVLAAFSRAIQDERI